MNDLPTSDHAVRQTIDASKVRTKCLKALGAAQPCTGGMQAQIVQALLDEGTITSCVAAAPSNRPNLVSRRTAMGRGHWPPSRANTHFHWKTPLATAKSLPARSLLDALCSPVMLLRAGFPPLMMAP